MKVSLNVCFLCHFKGAPHDQAVTGCPSCHSAPNQPIPAMGKTFSHDDALKAGYACSQCHIEITRVMASHQKTSVIFAMWTGLKNIMMSI
jgi:hypothetical protein